ncbi:hypothetical protein JX266_006727 [Neoarthrinium moseri]|nr:hypothetical protein JX266_006727 [Neoarthrinium moseri]
MMLFTPTSVAVLATLLPILAKGSPLAHIPRGDKYVSATWLPLAGNSSSLCDDSGWVRGLAGPEAPKAADCKAIGDWASKHTGHWLLRSQATNDDVENDGDWMFLHSEGSCGLLARPRPKACNSWVGAPDVVRIAAASFQDGSDQAMQGVFKTCSGSDCDANVDWAFTTDF